MDTATGAIPIAQAPDDDSWLRLEGGIEVDFTPGTYRTGDYWLIPARAFIGEFAGDIEWPTDGGGQALTGGGSHGVLLWVGAVGRCGGSVSWVGVVGRCRGSVRWCVGVVGDVVRGPPVAGAG